MKPDARTSGRCERRESACSVCAQKPNQRSMAQSWSRRRAAAKKQLRRLLKGGHRVSKPLHIHAGHTPQTSDIRGLGDLIHPGLLHMKEGRVQKAEGL